MNHLRPSRWIGFALLGLVVLSIGTRPELQAQQAPVALSAAMVGGAFGGKLDEKPADLQECYAVEAPPKSLDELKTFLKLQEKVPMNFPPHSTLGDVIKYIRQVTVDEKAGFPKGVLIYVDPEGLQDADKTLDSTVEFEFEGMRLEKSLRLILRQLSMTYKIDTDGLLMVEAINSDDSEPMKNETANWHMYNLLRAEVHALREEIRELRRSPGNSAGASAGLPDAASPRGGMGGGFR